MSEVPYQALVPVAPPGQPLTEEQQNAVLLFGSRGGVVWYSFDARTPEGMVLLDRCEEGPSVKLIEATNKTVNLRDVYAKECQFVNEESGDVKAGVRCCLIDTDGEVYACASEGVRQSLARLFRAHGMPPYKAGIPVLVTLKRLGGNRQWLTITNAPAANGKAGPKK